MSFGAFRLLSIPENLNIQINFVMDFHKKIDFQSYVTEITMLQFDNFFAIFELTLFIATKFEIIF